MALYIRVTDQRQRPVHGARVSLGFTNFFSGGFTGVKYTDENGVATFERDADREGDEFELFVNGRFFDHYQYRPGRTIVVAI